MVSNRHERRKAASTAGRKLRTNFTAAEVLELSEMTRLCNSERFKAVQFKGNTAIIPRGQEVAAEQDAMSRVLEQAKQQWISQKLRDHGFLPDEKCFINIETGEITLTEQASPELQQIAKEQIADHEKEAKEAGKKPKKAKK